jgi:RHH-type proline utilization regulon transcriptional repressor/proline dehydrogenase/delta 1-pyrroline-5-carboxylate dehydrogenase
MQELRVGNPDMLSTDVGPVIDPQAQAVIEKHIGAMRDAGRRVDQLGLDSMCQHGSFVPPTLIEIDDVSMLKREVFGPVLHVIRYKRDHLDALIDTVNATGYGLTFGVHTRLDETVAHVTDRIHAGNVYVNRNIVGAVVGVQPFGGEGLSGTGPKAGGPLYLLRLLSRRPAGLPDWWQGPDAGLGLDLPGPTGETNTYRLKPRGTVLGVAASVEGAQAQYQACAATGNTLALADTPAARDFLATCTPEQKKQIRTIPYGEIGQADYQAVLFEGDGDALRELNQTVAARSGPIVSVQGLSKDELASGHAYSLERLLREVSVSVNTAAAGGNASLMMVG